jgi:hypothetical protein
VLGVLAGSHGSISLLAMLVMLVSNDGYAGSLFSSDDCYADYAGWSFAFAGSSCWILILVILFKLAGWLCMLCWLVGYVYGGWLPMFSKLLIAYIFTMLPG